MSMRVTLCAIYILFAIETRISFRVQDPPSKAVQTQAAGDEITAPFWHSIEQGKLEEAAQEFSAAWPDRQMATNMMGHVKETMKQFGNYISRVEISHHNFGDRLIYSETVVFFEKSPVILELVYAKPRDQWIGQSVHWSTGGDNVFQRISDAAKRDRFVSGEQPKRP